MHGIAIVEFYSHHPRKNARDRDRDIEAGACMYVWGHLAPPIGRPQRVVVPAIHCKYVVTGSVCCENSNVDSHHPRKTGIMKYT